MASLLELASSWEGDIVPDVDSEMGRETWMMGMVGSSDGDDGIEPIDEVREGEGVSWTTGGDMLVEVGVVISKISVRGSVWTKMET